MIKTVPQGSTYIRVLWLSQFFFCELHHNWLTNIKKWDNAVFIRTVTLCALNHGAFGRETQTKIKPQVWSKTKRWIKTIVGLVQRSPPPQLWTPPNHNNGKGSCPTTKPHTTTLLYGLYVYHGLTPASTVDVTAMLTLSIGDAERCFVSNSTREGQGTLLNGACCSSPQ